MSSIKVSVIDPIGIHARPATQIVSVASKFKSLVTFKSGEKKANAKSIMNLMALGIKVNSEIEIITEGDDEKAALDALVAVMRTNKLIS